MSNAPIRSEFSRAEHSQLLARVAALEELLSVHEEVVLEQSKHLEEALSELRDFNAELEARVGERTQELSEANANLWQQFERERLMLETNNAVVSELDLRALLKAISLSLRQIVPHDGALLTLHDTDPARLRLQALDLQMPDQVPFAEGVLIEMHDTPEGEAITSRRPVLVCPTVDLVRFSSPWVRHAVENGVRSGCAVPLIAHERSLGALSVVSGRENAFNENDAELLNQCASQIAIAVENALNYQRAKQERDRFEMMLEVSNAVSASLDLRELLRVTSVILRKHMHHDFAGLLLFDEEHGMFRLLALDNPPEYLSEGALIPLEGTPDGLAYTTRQAVWRERLDLDEFYAPTMRQGYEAGLRSGCSVPLIARDNVIGTLGVGSNRESSITAANAETLQLIAHQIASAVENALNFARAQEAEQESRRQYERERLMLEINNAVVAQLDLRELVRVISASLREVLQPDVTGISLYDPDTNLFRAYRFDMPASFPPIPDGTPMPLDGTVGGRAFESGQPIFMSRPDPVLQSSEFDRRLMEAGIQSGGVVPLIAHDKKLGFLGVGSFREDAFPPADQELLCHIANQIAIAVENSLNFERAQQAEQESRRRYERERLMLEINNAVVANLTLRDLLAAISGCLRRVVPHDFAGLALYDATVDQLRVQALDYQRNQEIFGPNDLIPLQGTGSGKAFRSHQTLLWSDERPAESSIAVVQQVITAGFKSSCHVPLVVQDRALGTLDVMSARPNAFTEADAELLTQVGQQIAIAIENALNFERAVQAEQEVQRKLERERLMLEINNAVVTQLDLRELVRVVSSCLRETLHYEIVGLSLYHPEANELRTYAYDLPDKQSVIPEGTAIPLEGSLGGRAFVTGQSLFFNRPDPARTVSPFNQRFADIGVKSGGCVPLIAYGRKLGVLGVASLREDAFPPADQELLNQVANQIALAVKNALDYQEIESLKNKLAEEKLYLEEEINTAYNFEEIIGSSPALRRILKQVETVAPTDSTVLIGGETGTGKELIARAIHNLSARHERTLVKLNCAAIPSGLLESELFGHERGAFTGAIAQRIGRFELAHKGTLFLDEVGEIPLDLQPKLLRVLQEQEFERLGNARTQKVDVRLIAATNRDLAAMSAENKYRSDLYYRLNVFPITIPPLRERQDDIPLLARFFANKFAVRMKKQIKTIPAEIVAALQRYHWPGNIRELENMIERAVILTQGTELQIPLPELPVAAKTAVAVAPSIPPPAAPPSSDTASLEAIEREHILRILRETNWVVGGPTGAAARLGLKRTTLQNRMAKLGIARAR